MSSENIMTDQTINEHYRLFLLVFAGLIFASIPIELFFAEHTQEPVQFIPFVLCGLGLAGVVAALLLPKRGTLLTLRWDMCMVALGSLFGIFKHIQGNIDFALEIQPNAVISQVFFEALKGAAPLLAPGILAIAAVLALAATYHHPVLEG